MSNSSKARQQQEVGTLGELCRVEGSKTELVWIELACAEQLGAGSVEP